MEVQLLNAPYFVFAGSLSQRNVVYAGGVEEVVFAHRLGYHQIAVFVEMPQYGSLMVAEQQCGKHGAGLVLRVGYFEYDGQSSFVEDVGIDSEGDYKVVAILIVRVTTKL